MLYNYSGLPYSDELFHHGVKDQRWGFRRYQNKDGSLTALGRIHYGVGQATKATGQALKTAGKAVSKAYKKKHPSAMTDEELKKAVERINLENQYKQAMEKNRPQISRARRVAEDILESTTKSLASGLVDRWNLRMRNLVDLDKTQDQYNLEADRDRRKYMDQNKMGAKYEKYVRKTLPSNYSKWTDSDWEKYNKFIERRESMRRFESPPKPKK